MSLFFKHLLQSIKRKPLQPFIMILTLTLAIFMAVSALSMKDLLVEEARLSSAAQYGETDLTVSLNGSSKSRFMFQKDAATLLGDAATVVGTYEILLSFPEGGAPVFAVASELHEIGEVFTFSFSAYGKITEGALSTTALISRELAEEKGLRIGDSVTVTLFSQSVTYTVQGISSMPYLGKYDVLVDIKSVVNALAAKSVIAAALGDDFQPSSTLYVDVKGALGVEECVHILRTDPMFVEKTFTDVKMLTESQSNVSNLNIAIDISVVLICALAMAVTFCCFYILADERHEQNLSFAAAGASPFKLNLIQYAEVLLYWGVGSACGIFASLGAIGGLCKLVALKYAVAKLSPVALLLSPSIMLLASLMTVTVFVLLSKQRKSRRTRNAVGVFVLLAVVIGLMVAVFVAPHAIRVYLGIGLTVAVLLFSFATVPWGIKRVAAFASSATDAAAAKGRRVCVSLRYAAKNLCVVRPLHNVSRLISVFVTVVMMVFIVVVATHNYIDIANAIFTRDYVVVGATRRCAQKIEACDEVQLLEGAYFSTVILEGNVSTLLISAQNTDAIHGALKISELPSGNEAWISKSVARSMGVDIGERLHVVSNGMELELVVKKIQGSPLPYVCFNFEDVGVTPNLFMPRFREGVGSAEGLSAISAAIAYDVAVITSTNELLTEKTKSLNVYLNCGDILWVMLLLFSAIGITDCIYNNYRARKEELELFSVSGTSRGQLSRLKLAEVLGALSFGCVTGILFALLLIPFVNQALMSFGIEMIELFMSLL